MVNKIRKRDNKPKHIPNSAAPSPGENKPSRFLYFLTHIVSPLAAIAVPLLAVYYAWWLNTHNAEEIKGIVVDSLSKEILNGVRIQLKKNDTQILDVYSKPDGGFNLSYSSSEISKNEHLDLELSRDKYFTKTLLLNQFSRDLGQVTLRPKTPEDNLCIRGNVKDKSTSRPIFGASVKCKLDGTSDSTDSAGNFFIKPKQKSEEYRIKIEHRSYQTIEQNISLVNSPVIFYLDKK